MSDYIDRNEAKSELFDWAVNLKNPKYLVPLVRCRDCCASGEDGWICCGSGMMPAHGTFPHLFCSEGKPKDGDEVKHETN